MREALKTLVVLGIVEIRPNSGTYISENVDRSLNMYSFALLARHSNHLNLLEFRRVLEIETARLAARRVTPEDLDLLRWSVEDFEKAVREGLDPMEPDSAFHRGPAQAPQNMIMVLIIDSLPTSLIRVPVLETSSIKYHRAIYEAVNVNDRDRAAELMAAHLETLEPFFVKRSDTEIGSEIASEKEQLKAAVVTLPMKAKECANHLITTRESFEILEKERESFLGII